MSDSPRSRKPSLFDRPSVTTSTTPPKSAPSLFATKPMSASSSTKTLADEGYNETFQEFPQGSFPLGATYNNTPSSSTMRPSFAAQSTSYGSAQHSPTDYQSAPDVEPAPESSGGFQGHSSVPLAIALLPPLLATFVPQKSEIWGDLFAMFLVAYYLHFIISAHSVSHSLRNTGPVPYELYQKSRVQTPMSRVLESTLEETDFEGSLKEGRTGGGPSPSSAAVREAQEAAERELFRWQMVYLVLYLSSPILAGIALKIGKDNLFSSNGPIVKQLNIGAFVFVATLRPLGEVVELLRERTLYLKKEIATPVTEVDSLLHRISELERTVEVLQREGATREEVESVKEKVVGPSLDKIARTVRKVERRGSSKMEMDEQRFRELERRLMESEELFLKLQASRDVPTTPERLLHLGTLSLLFQYVASFMDLILWPWKVASGVLKLVSGTMQDHKWVGGSTRKAMIEGTVPVKEE
ncbi:hypothetical protein HDU93_001120 [Gonapodya sp. JEL0774]|nr:hypothetical protein HDU93_001120 [Gonapodya sp. JEL0774]